MPPRYSPNDEPQGDADPQPSDSAGRRVSRLLTAGLIVVVALLVCGGLRGRRR